VISVFFFLFSSPNISGRRLDVYHTSTHGVASNISSRCPHNMANFGPLVAEIGSGVWGTPAHFSGFRVFPCYCSDVTHRWPAKLCMMFGHLLGWYIIYIHIYIFGGSCPLTEFFRCKIHFTSKSCMLLYWQRY